MGADFLPGSRGNAFGRLVFFLLLVCTHPAFGKDDAKIQPSLFTWDLLWTGSFSNNVKIADAEFPAKELFDGVTLYNRLNFILGIPGLDLSLRCLVTDKRLLPLAEDDPKAGFNPGGGIYHRSSGSRILYGVQSEYGLPSRISNIWLRAIPFTESRHPSSRDLKAEPSASNRPETFIYLALPPEILKDFSVFASAALDEELSPAFGGGAWWNGLGPLLRLEGFYTKKKLDPKNQSTWFSSSPSLPERDFNIYAASLFVHFPKAAFGTDWAYSDTFAFGNGAYGNFSFRLGNKPWRFSMAADGATDRFVDRGGSNTGDGLRLAAKGEHFWPRSGLFRVQGSLRSSGLEEDFSRGSFQVYFRPSAPTAAEKRQEKLPLRFSRTSLSVNRDARKPEKTDDSLNALLGFTFGPLSSVFSCTLHSLSFLEEKNSAIFQAPLFESFNTLKISGDFGWKPFYFRLPAFKDAPNTVGSLDLKTRIGYTIRAEKDPIWDFSLNSSVKAGKLGRIGIKIGSTDFPEKWNYAFSWRFNYKI